MSAFTDLYGDWPAGLFYLANLNKKPLCGMYDNAQSRSCPNSLHLPYKSEKYAICKSLKVVPKRGMKSIQTGQKRREAGSYKRMLIRQGTRVYMQTSRFTGSDLEYRSNGAQSVCLHTEKPYFMGIYKDFC